MVYTHDVKKAAEILSGSRFAIALTGAGISADSGIPTFRGRDGLWQGYRPEDLATPEAFRRDPVKVWRWYLWRLELISSAKPNDGHKALAALEKLGVLKCVVTQNVDCLHQLAGSRCVIELHGNIRRARCDNCGYKDDVSRILGDIPPHCPRCNHIMRPDVVWFGELIPDDIWEKTVELFTRSDVVLVVGTSSTVMPAAMLPVMSKEKGARIIEVNVESSALTYITDIFIRGRASVVLPAILREVENMIRR
ncbi:MAG: NAD-dependent protein deacylase [Thermoprotei archaeon]|nr:MAG: NAD-dependent protein deacylase [Thermoprotei archaeon]